MRRVLLDGFAGGRIGCAALVKTNHARGCLLVGGDLVIDVFASQVRAAPHCHDAHN